MPNENIDFQFETEVEDFRKYAAIDIEHNGSTGDNDQILEVAAVFVEDGRVTETYASKIGLNDGVEFNTHLEKIGLEAEKYIGQPPECEILPGFVRRIRGCRLVAHDIKEDLVELNRRLQKYSVPELKPSTADTWKLAKDAKLDCRYNLGSVAAHLELGGYEEHTVPGDAMMHARVYEWLMHHHELAYDADPTPWE